MNKPDKEIIVWIHNGGGQYVPHFFDSEEQAMLYEKMTDDWYMTRAYNQISSIYFRFEMPKAPTPPKGSSTNSPA